MSTGHQTGPLSLVKIMSVLSLNPLSCTAFNTLPVEFRKIYGIQDSPMKNTLLSFNLLLLKYTRPFLPPFFRLIAPARWAQQRLTKFPDLKFQDKAKY